MQIKRAFNEADIVRVHSYDAVAIEAISGRKKVPSLALNLTHRPDIAELFRVHSEVPPGDALSSWGVSKKHKDRLFLEIEFERPARLRLIIELLFEKHGGVIFGIDHTKLVYLKAANIEKTPGAEEFSLKDSIFVEIGAKDFPVDWKSWYRELGYNRLIQNGLSRKIAWQGAESIIDAQFSFWREPVEFVSDA